MLSDRSQTMMMYIVYVPIYIVFLKIQTNFTVAESRTMISLGQGMRHRAGQEGMITKDYKRTFGVMNTLS